MEFIAGPGGHFTPDPETPPASAEQLASTEAAMELFSANAERIRYYTQRVKELGRSGLDTVVTLMNVDDPRGGILADVLMPDHDWQSYRDAGEVPIARGLAMKAMVTDLLRMTGCETAARELSETDDLRVVLLEANVALVLDVEFTNPDTAADPTE